MAQKISRMKVIHDYLPTHAKLHERDKNTKPTCPRCRKYHESQLHVFQCRDELNSENHKVCMKQLRSSLRRCKTHLIIVQAIENFLTGVHLNKRPIFPKNMMGDVNKILITTQVFNQQIDLGIRSLHKGIISRNWTLAQNVCNGEANKEDKNLPWLKQFIRALWNYSTSMWIRRCKNIHVKDKSNPFSLNHRELTISIREILRTNRSELSYAEKKLHLNVVRGLNVAHTSTLVKWLVLLAKERENEIRRKRESRNSAKGKLQTLLKFFKVRRK